MSISTHGSLSNLYDNLLEDQYWLLEYFARKDGWVVIDGPRTAHLYSIGLLERDVKPPFKVFRLNERGMTVVRSFRRRCAELRIDLDVAYEEAKVSSALPPL
jgi:hypothetical protein